MSVRLERTPVEGAWAVVMDRPEALNALSTSQARELTRVCAEVAAQDDLRVVLLTSALDRAFCVGADLKERQQMDEAGLLAQRPVLVAAFAAVSALPVPTVAVVDGHALGGGFELALRCDLVVAGPGARFALPEVGVGLVPGGGGTQLLSRRVGLNRALDLVLTGRHVDVADAERLGLVDRRGEDATATALELAGVVASRSPLAVRAARTAVRAGFDLPLPEALEVEDAAWHEAATSADRVEGIDAFVTGREPRWPSARGGR
ncbi:enoyl-CoA hydratase/isomerase family protein [Auraticoccus monumenti]|uniref:enoyl-CoA hydratase n=1 Tax=Auraticoccus monumenti TaxID=675864 RepID=A0A1G6Y0J6_9ACTN|nr:enoyl-CoA hydratase/isomerase family protein [Auraticoccus monumenti]SDD83791.1 Enoyl-CoA hydratase/carnithine racemase [Auraticoccus monumenti]